MVSKVHFSSERTDWEAPDILYEIHNREFNFGLDATATKENSKCEFYIDEEIDFLKQDLVKGTDIKGKGESVSGWTKPKAIWMNPPYGDPEFPCKRTKKGELRCKKKICRKRGHHQDTYIPGCIDFVKHAYKQSLNGIYGVVLLPARTDTELFHQYVMKASEIRFIVGRIKFKGAKHPAPFPSMVVIFKSKGFATRMLSKAPKIISLELPK